MSESSPKTNLTEEGTELVGIIYEELTNFQTRHGIENSVIRKLLDLLKSKFGE